MRESTRNTIERGIEKFRYQPNFHATNLSRNKARAIGIIVPTIIDPFYSALVNTIELYAEEHGYLTILQSSHHDPKSEALALRRLASMNVVGIAMAALGRSTDIGVLRDTQTTTPIVFMDSRLADDISYIGTNNQQSVAMMVDYLCRSGTPPLFFNLPPLNSNIVDRQDVYFERMRALGREPILVNPDPIPARDNFERFGFEQFLLILREVVPKGSTILCVNDRVAFGLLAAAAKLGLRVGKGPEDDLRVAGHDDQHFSKFTNPSLTTVAQNTKQIGILSAQALLENKGAGGHIAQDHLIDGEIKFRESA